jgi:hypothetical protein
MFKNNSAYSTLIGGLATLGHLGEGHWKVSNMTSAASLKTEQK